METHQSTGRNASFLQFFKFSLPLPSRTVVNQVVSSCNKLLRQEKKLLLHMAKANNLIIFLSISISVPHSFEQITV